MLDRRAEQDSLFDAPLRGTMAWDMLLVLYVADAEGRRLTGREAIEAAGARLEVGRRWLSFLDNEDIVTGDGKLTVDVPVTLTPHAVSRLEEWIERCRQSGRASG